MIDEACARLKIDQEKKPESLLKIEREIEDLNIQLQSSQSDEVQRQLDILTSNMLELTKSWQKTLATIKELSELREHTFFMKNEIIQAKNKQDFARHQIIDADIKQKVIKMNNLYELLDENYRAVDSSHIANIVGKSTGNITISIKYNSIILSFINTRYSIWKIVRG